MYICCTYNSLHYKHITSSYFFCTWFTSWKLLIDYARSIWTAKRLTISKTFTLISNTYSIYPWLQSCTFSRILFVLKRSIRINRNLKFLLIPRTVCYLNWQSLMRNNIWINMWYIFTVQYDMTQNWYFSTFFHLFRINIKRTLFSW